METSSPNSDPVRAALLTPDGVLELVDVAPGPWAIGNVVGAIGPVDLWMRATWLIRGAVLTAWTAKSSPASQPNALAARVVDELLPRPKPGVPDRPRDAFAAHGLYGPVLITGYQPATGDQPGQTIALADVAVEQIRTAADGRRARREMVDARTVALDAVTAPLFVPTPPTEVLPVLAPAGRPAAPNLLAFWPNASRDPNPTRRERRRAQSRTATA